MLSLSGAPFSFRYVSFQKGMHRAPEFLALSRWGQVPVLLDGDRVHVQSAAIVEYLAAALGRFEGPDAASRQTIREWLYWDVDVLFPPIWNCYGVQLGERKLLPISVDPKIAAYNSQRAEKALQRSEAYLAEAQRLTHTGSFGWNLSSDELWWSKETFRILAYEPTTKPSMELALQRYDALDEPRPLGQQSDSPAGFQSTLRIIADAGC